MTAKDTKTDAKAVTLITVRWDEYGFVAQAADGGDQTVQLLAPGPGRWPGRRKQERRLLHFASESAAAAALALRLAGKPVPVTKTGPGTYQFTS